jgi:hypothetical protein
MLLIALYVIIMLIKSGTPYRICHTIKTRLYLNWKKISALFDLVNNVRLFLKGAKIYIDGEGNICTPDCWVKRGIQGNISTAEWHLPRFAPSISKNTGTLEEKSITLITHLRATMTGSTKKLNFMSQVTRLFLH